MDEFDTIIQLLETTPYFVFLYLFWQERKRSSQLADERVDLMRECNDRLEKIVIKVDQARANQLKDN